MLSGGAHTRDDGGDLCTQPLTSPSGVKLTICREKGPGTRTASEDEKKRRDGPAAGAQRIGGSGSRSTGTEMDKVEKEKKAKSKKSHRHQHHRHHHRGSGEKGSRRTSSRRRKKLINYQQRNLSPYFKNATLKPLQHPLEENIFFGLAITLVAVAVAFVIGIPVLLITGVLLATAVLIRYLSVIMEGCFNYFRFLCSNRTFPSSATSVPYIFPRDRLAFANDVRWLGERSPRKCQSILHTVLIFEGSMELTSLRNFIQTRVLEAETIDGEIAYPRLMEKLVALFGGHRWESDSKFDIKNHIFYGPTDMKTEAQIQEHLGSLLTQSLPDDKPLWEIQVFPCYGSLRDTLAIVRVHQCLADGMTLVRILLHSLADQQQLHVPQRPNFASLSFGFNVLRSLIVGPLTLFLWFCMTAKDRNFFSRPLYGSSKNHSTKNNSNSSASSIAHSINRIRGWRNSLSGGSSRPTSSSSKQNMTLLTQNDRSKRYHQQKRRDTVNDLKGIGTKVTTTDETRAVSRSSSGKASSTPSAAIDNNQQTQGQQGIADKGHSKRIQREESTGQSSSTATTATSAPHKKKTFNDDSNCNTGLWKVGWSACLTVPKIARVKQIMRSSFNDVLLSAAAGSIRKYLQKQGIAFPGDVKVVIPVDLRNDISDPKVSKRLGCKVASILAAIPSGIEAAIPRLWATRQRLDEVKASADPVVAYGATAVLINILPQKLGAFVLNNITDKASLQFCNLSGPTSTLMVGGFPLKGVYPIYPPSGKIRVAITVFTYSDQVHVTVVSHRSMPNFCQSLLTGMSQQVDQLSKQLSHRRVPGESRRSARNASTINTEITKPPTKQIHFQLQVVQEELQELSHKLDHQEPFSYSISGEDDENVGRVLAGEPSGQLELRSRLKTLKSEFTELMGELRRRTSIVEGVTISFEDEEMEEEFRKPRKRALSVVSTSARRNSLFTTPRILMTPESSHHSYSSDENLPTVTTTPPRQHQSPELHRYSPSPTTSMHHSSSSTIRTTAV